MGFAFLNGAECVWWLFSSKGISILQYYQNRFIKKVTTISVSSVEFQVSNLMWLYI